MIITIQEIISELNREIAARQSVYPRLVQKRKMSQYTSDRRISLISAAIRYVSGQPMRSPGRAEVLEELRREIALRRVMYPRWIDAGRLNREIAELRIARLTKAFEMMSGDREQIAMDFIK